MTWKPLYIHKITYYYTWYYIYIQIHYITGTGIYTLVFNVVFILHTSKYIRYYITHHRWANLPHRFFKDLFLELARAKLQLHSSTLVAAQASHSEWPPWRTKMVKNTGSLWFSWGNHGEIMGKSWEHLGIFLREIQALIMKVIAGQNGRTKWSIFQQTTELITGG